MTKNNNPLDIRQSEEILKTLELRFAKNPNRHTTISWEDVRKRLMENPDKLWSVNEMEATGGEPDVIGYDQQKEQFIFCDCSKETPAERRNLCYDREALESRKTFQPGNSVIDMANEMGIELMTEDQYRQLQQLGTFDTKTSSWLLTPASVRQLGGAIFGDWRYGRVFIYHNGAQSYYGVRGFRGILYV